MIHESLHKSQSYQKIVMRSNMYIYIKVIQNIQDRTVMFILIIYLVYDICVRLDLMSVSQSTGILLGKGGSLYQYCLSVSYVANISDKGKMGWANGNWPTIVIKEMSPFFNSGPKLL